MVTMSRGNCKVRGSQMGIKRTINQKVNLILNRISCTNRTSAFVYRFWGLAVSPHFNHELVIRYAKFGVSLSDFRISDSCKVLLREPSINLEQSVSSQPVPLGLSKTPVIVDNR